jgi:hypothetical protein
MIVVDYSLLQIAVAALLPLITAVVTKEVTHPAVKAVTLAVLAGLVAVGQAALANAGLVTDAMVTDAVISFIIAVTTYYGLWKPTSTAPFVAQKTDEKGIGLLVKEKPE